MRDQVLDHPVRLCLWGFTVLLVAPVLIGQLTARAANATLPPERALDPSSRAHGWRGTVQGLVGSWDQPSIWDAVVLSQRLDGCFVVVEFNDGRRVAGAFGVGSAAMNHPGRPGLFLTTEWALDEDGDLMAEIPDSRGVMLPTWTMCAGSGSRPSPGGTMIAGKRRDSEDAEPTGTERQPGQDGIVPGRKATPKVPPRKLRASFSALALPPDPDPQADPETPDGTTQSPG